MELKTWKKYGGFHPLLLQLQDFEYWLRLSKYGMKFTVIGAPLIQYRIRDDLGNLSTNKHTIRSLNELTFIYKHVFDDITHDSFISHFSDDLRKLKVLDQSFREQKNHIFLKHEAAFVRLLGFQDILLQNIPNNLGVVTNEPFSELNFFELGAKIDALNIGRIEKLTNTLIEHKTC